MQACASSSTQTTIELDFYQDNGNSSEYLVINVLVDSSANQYLIHSDSIIGNLFVTKKSSNGSYDWSFEYPTIDSLMYSKSAVLSSDGNTLRILGEKSSATSQFVQISTCKYDSIKHTIHISQKLIPLINFSMANKFKVSWLVNFHFDRNCCLHNLLYN